MKATVTEFEFVQEMRKEKYGFSYEGAEALFFYLEDLEVDGDYDVEYDPIAFRCDYSEYENFKAIQDDYKDLKDLEDLYSNTQVIEIPNTKRIIIQQY